MALACGDGTVDDGDGEQEGTDMRASELKTRTRTFAVMIMQLTEELPKKPGASVVARPLLRAGTAIGAMLRSACSSRNRWDFSSRLRGVEEATEETLYWLQITQEAKLLPAPRIDPVIAECRELQRIFRKSRRIADQRVREKENSPDWDPGASPEQGGPNDDIPF